LFFQKGFKVIKAGVGAVELNQGRLNQIYPAFLSYWFYLSYWRRGRGGHLLKPCFKPEPGTMQARGKEHFDGGQVTALYSEQGTGPGKGRFKAYLKMGTLVTVGGLGWNLPAGSGFKGAHI
jgi:hypothetical protein